MFLTPERPRLQMWLSMPRWLRSAWPHDQWRLNQFTVVVSAGLINTAFFLMIPSMPQFVRLLGVATPHAVMVWTGIIIGIPPVIAGLVGPLWGKFADRHGYKIHALRTTLAVCVVYYVSSRCENVLQLLGLRVLLGFVGGFQTLTMALATQLCPAPRTPLVIGSVQISQITAGALAPFAGGVLMGWIGIRHTLVISSMLCLISFLLYAVLYRDAPERPTANGIDREPVRLLSLPNFALLAISVFIVTVIEKGLQPAVPLFALTHSADARRAALIAGIILALAAVGDTLAVWYCGRGVRRGRARALLVRRWAWGALLSSALAVSDAVLPFGIFRCLLAVLAGGTLTVAYAMASFVIPAQVRATGFAVLSSCALIGAGVGPLLISALSSRGLRAVFVVNAVFYLFLMVVAGRNLQVGTAQPFDRNGG